MLEIFLSGGWLMFPILLCSMIALAIIVERTWTLQNEKIVPPTLLSTVLHHVQNRQISKSYINEMSEQSPLGSVFARGLAALSLDYESMVVQMTEQGRYVIHDLEKFLNTLGTVAAVAPLIGLLGTVMGMIQIFSALSLVGPTSMEGLAGGISQALLTTAFGLFVAIPALMFHRHFQRKIDEIAFTMEQDSIKLAEYVKIQAQKNVG